MAITGSCLCGACRYASPHPPLNVRICHCRRCQKATGSAFYARAMVPQAGLTIAGPVGWFDAGTGVRRGFCERCGTTLFSERSTAGTIGLSLGSIDGPCPAPDAHIWTSHEQPWLHLDDGLPRHAEGPPA